MEAEQKFKTKTGFCHILTDRIVLTRDGFRGNVAEVISGNKTSGFLIIYGLVAVLMFYNAYSDFVKENWFFFGFYLLIGIYLIYGIIKSKNYSASPVIFRQNIKTIKFIPAKKFLTRSHFKVRFEQEDGKEKTRLIMLPGSLSDGPKETIKAVDIMRGNGFLVK
ncbi:phosphoribosylaminoimidazole-succinocarboxamide synthase [unidentified eubacterium SCB49]|nr:phosphoribosylaminoimidazole-succinocarboxamide synthase [unidentified eubacterium SCB49]